MAPPRSARARSAASPFRPLLTKVPRPWWREMRPSCSSTSRARRSERRPTPSSLGQHALGRHPPGVEIALLDQLPQPAEGLVGSLHRQGTCKDGSIPPSAGVDQARSTRPTNSMKGGVANNRPHQSPGRLTLPKGNGYDPRQFREGQIEPIWNDWFACPKADRQPRCRDERARQAGRRPQSPGRAG